MLVHFLDGGYGPNPVARSSPPERPESLRVFGYLPVSGREGLHGGRRPKSLEGGNRGGVRADAGVGLWGICRRHDLVGKIAALQRDLEEEAQCAGIGVDSRYRRSDRRQPQLVPMDILGGGLV